MSDAAKPGNGPARSLPWGWVATGVVVFVLVALTVMLLRGPQDTLEAIHQAAASRDSAAIERNVDLPALKHSLGRLLLQQVGGALPDDKGDNRKMMGQFMLAGALVGPLVETIVTPDGIGALLRGQIAARAIGGGGAQGPLPKYQQTWDGLSAVRATALSADGDPGSLVLVLRRHGLFWKLAGVEARQSTTVKQVK